MNYHMVMGDEKPTKENFIKVIGKLYGEKATEVLKLYNPASDEEVEQVATDFAGDRFISYSTWKWADVHSKTSGKPVYRYLFERARPEMVPEMGNATAGLAGGVQTNTNAPKSAPAKGAVHSAEIEYAMGNLASNKIYAWTADDYKVSGLMQNYFAEFIKKGNPNLTGFPSWPEVNKKNPVPVMHINVHSRVQPEKFRERYLFMERTSSNASE